MGHVDATLRLLDPSIDIDQIPNKRPRKRIKLFRQGELGRLIVGVLREADTPISTQDIQRDPRRWRSRGVSQAERHAARAGNLAYLHNREKVSKSGSGKDVRWELGN